MSMSMLFKEVMRILQARRMADALLIASLAGSEAVAQAQRLYMRQHPSPYMRIVRAIQGNDFVSEYLPTCALCVPFRPMTLSVSSFLDCTMHWQGVLDKSLLHSQAALAVAAEQWLIDGKPHWLSCVATACWMNP